MIILKKTILGYVKWKYSQKVENWVFKIDNQVLLIHGLKMRMYPTPEVKVQIK